MKIAYRFWDGYLDTRCDRINFSFDFDFTDLHRDRPIIYRDRHGDFYTA